MARWLVVGLGNPGPAYARQRHNVGAMVAAELARRGAARWQPRRLLQAELAEIKIGAAGTGAVGADLEQVTLARTRTYMNESGGPVKQILSQLRLKPDHLIVIHDELDLDFTRLRAKFGGGDNGHNGLKSIRARLGTGDYYRVRVGIGRPTGRIDVHDWVLSNFGPDQTDDLPQVVARAADAVECLTRHGLEAAQQGFNS